MFSWITEVLSRRDDEMINVLNALLLIGPRIKVDDTSIELDIDIKIENGSDGIDRIFRKEKGAQSDP